MEKTTPTAYVCTINYGELETKAPFVNVASYTFTPPKPTSHFRPTDTITFRFNSTAGLSTPTVATLMTAYKAKNANPDISPFLHHRGAIDILAIPTLTIGKVKGTWGIASMFTVEDGSNSHFFFLPDPEIIVGPE